METLIEIFSTLYILFSVIITSTLILGTGYDKMATYLKKIIKERN